MATVDLSTDGVEVLWSVLSVVRWCLALVTARERSSARSGARPDELDGEVDQRLGTP